MRNSDSGITTDKRDRECYGRIQSVSGRARAKYCGLQRGRELVTLGVTFNDISVDSCGL
jgi:hypothetical protein